MIARLGIGYLGIMCLGVAAACCVSAAHQPPVGSGGWLTAFAGDWIVPIGGGYEIGNSPQRSGGYTVYRSKPVGDDGATSKFLLVVEVRDVLQYVARDGSILLRTRSGFAWRSLGPGSDWAWGEHPPAELDKLVASLAPPRRSYRPELTLLALCFAIAGVLVVVRWHLASRHH